MSKKIDLKRSVYELTTQYPELIEVLASLGLNDIKKKFIGIQSVNSLQSQREQACMAST